MCRIYLLEANCSFPYLVCSNRNFFLFSNTPFLFKHRQNSTKMLLQRAKIGYQVHDKYMIKSRIRRKRCRTRSRRSKVSGDQTSANTLTYAAKTGNEAHHSRFGGSLLGLEEDCFGFAAARAELVGSWKLMRMCISHGNFRTRCNLSMTRDRAETYDE
ncbi:hypothetical protein ASPCADRAFT_133429 [Aspergillus carbonarius ITEM 5010]|uniref:Uncharacterized protein n=1 Tax=Aspergillus carbonarius (strain ITEM 5010) TaxID=602072 RepID=A0A1R3RD79_ASPC5|nr:hypothetical protein ASPCADRAFT_133429 [Aspergillus carbonarius ITEM 5010]